jgi:hypothetical protein
LTPETIDVVVYGSPGVPEGSFWPLPKNRIEQRLVPPHKRFPNERVWFDLDADGSLRYVEAAEEA